MIKDERPQEGGNELAETGGEPGSGSTWNARQNSQQRREPQHGSQIPSIDELLVQLLRLNGAVVMGAISAKDAALINRNIKAVLDVQLKRSSRNDGPLGQEVLAEKCRRDPSLLAAVSPFLSPEQVEELMSDVMDDGQDESA